MKSRWPAILAVALAIGALVFLFVRSGQRKPPSAEHVTRATKVVVRDDRASMTLERRGSEFAYHGSIDGGPDRTGTIPASIVETFLAAAASPDGGTPNDRRIGVTISGIPGEPGTIVLTKLEPELVAPYGALIEAMSR